MLNKKVKKRITNNKLRRSRPEAAQAYRDMLFYKFFARELRNAVCDTTSLPPAR